jgi:hypothetical protein
VPATASRTPILDRLEPLPPVRGARVLEFGKAPIIVGVLIGFVLAFVDVSSHLGILREYAIAMVSLLFATVAIHEAGHAMVGRLVGFRVHSIRIWRLQLEFPLRLSIFRGPMGGAGGWAICTPETTDRLAMRATVMFLAGPAVNLLSAVIVYALPGSTGTLLPVFLVWSLTIGVVNLLPLRTGPMFSDGYRILMLLFDRARGERLLALLTLSKDLMDGVGTESLSPEFIRIATAVKDESSDTVSAHMLAYSAAFRLHRCDEAAEHLEVSLRYSSRTSKPYQAALMADAAVFNGRCRKDAAAAEAWLNDIPVKAAIPWHLQWAEAGVLHARGERDALLAKLNAIDRAIRDHGGPYQTIALNAVEFWRTELEASRPA